MGVQKAQKKALYLSKIELQMIMNYWIGSSGPNLGLLQDQQLLSYHSSSPFLSFCFNS